MITSDLFQKVLINPAQNDCNNLLIVAGYASSAMAFHHLIELRKIAPHEVTIKLIIGMSSIDGISLTNHSGFQTIMSKEFPNLFECSYRIAFPPVHSKVYLWLKDDTPTLSYLGSANYTQLAFKEHRQLETLTECSPEKALSYYESMIDDSIYCTHPDSENIIQIYNEKFIRKPLRVEEIDEEGNLPSNIKALESVKVSLLDRSGNIHNKAGLNWGQRKGREPNQAYLQLSPTVYKSNFFPKRPVHFTVHTDDNKTLICVRAQKTEMGAAIETPLRNSDIGEYFRRRLVICS